MKSFIHTSVVRRSRIIFLYLLAALVSSVLVPRTGVAESTTVIPSALPLAVSPSVRVFGESDLLLLLTRTLQQDFVKDRGTLELSLKTPWSAPTLPDVPLRMKILETPSGGVASSFVIRFELCTPTTTLGIWQVAAQGHVWREVWVAHSNLHRGENVSDADIRRERFDVLNVREELAEFSGDDASLEIAGPASAGVPLLARMVKLRAVIHRGQVANALLEEGALSISTKVQALEDGVPGQTIRARNPISRRELTGRVLDNQTILISL